MLLFICILDVILKSIYFLNYYKMLRYIVTYAILHCVKAPYQCTRNEKVHFVAEYLRNNDCMISTQRALEAQLKSGRFFTFCVKKHYCINN